MLPRPLPHPRRRSWLGLRLSILIALFLFLCFLPPAHASPANSTATPDAHPCTKQRLLQRQEWRTLSAPQKKAYIAAVQCLQRLPALTSHLFPAVKTRFDDFQALHINLTDRVHLVGQFLPWHRRFVSVYEAALRKECGYRGANPYWDWTRDSKNLTTLLHSPLFDPHTGFGSALPYPGPGPSPVLSGPFSSYTLSLGPGAGPSPHAHPHALTRALNATLLAYLTPAQVRNTTRQPTFERFRIELEGAPVTPRIKIHDAGHRLVGGDMGDTYSSPGDPLFFLHHANLDRIWWEWQMADPTRRLYAISGRASVGKGPPYGEVTLAFGLEMGALAPRVPIRDVMDVRSGEGCYEYV